MIMESPCKQGSMFFSGLATRGHSLPCPSLVTVATVPSGHSLRRDLVQASPLPEEPGPSPVDLSLDLSRELGESASSFSPQDGALRDAFETVAALGLR